EVRRSEARYRAPPPSVTRNADEVPGVVEELVEAVGVVRQHCAVLDGHGVDGEHHEGHHQPRPLGDANGLERDVVLVQGDHLLSSLDAMRTSALRAAAATAEPPFSPMLDTAGSPLSRSACFDSAAPTNPTGRPITSAGSAS